MDNYFLFISHDIWEKKVCIECEEYGVMKELLKYFSNLIVPFQKGEDNSINVRCLKQCLDEYIIYVNDKTVQEKIPRELVLGMIIEIVSSALVLKNMRLAFLHGGAVQYNGRTICLVGESHSGKTSLMLSLLKRGWRIGHDDICPIDVRKGRYVEFFMPLMVRDTGYVDLTELDTLMQFQTYNMKTQSTETRRIISIFNQRIAQNASIDVILHLHRDKNKDYKSVDFQRLDKAFAAKTLALNNRDPLDPYRVLKDSLALASKIPVYHVEYGDAKSLAKLIDENIRRYNCDWQK